MEHVARPGAEQIDNEKAAKLQDATGRTTRPAVRAPGRASPHYLTRLNGIRRCVPAVAAQHHLPSRRRLPRARLQQESVDRSMQPDGSTWDDSVILVVANPNPHSTATTMIHLDMPALGCLRSHEGFIARRITGQEWPVVPGQPYRHARRAAGSAHHPRPPLLLDPPQRPSRPGCWVEGSDPQPNLINFTPTSGSRALWTAPAASLRPGTLEGMPHPDRRLNCPCCWQRASSSSWSPEASA